MGRSGRRRAAVLLGMLGAGLAATPSASAQAIRVLLVVPTESGRLTRQVSRLNDALLRSESHIVAAQGLRDADAVVQITGYRRAFDDKGESEDWWEGQFKLLTPAARDAKSAPAAPERFKLLVIGREDGEVKPALDLLSNALARALGRESPKKARDSI